MSRHDKRAGRVAGRASHLFKGAKNLWDKIYIAKGGRFSALPVFQQLQIYLASENLLNPEIFPDDASKIELARNIEGDLLIFLRECVRKGDHKSLRLFAEAVEHYGKSSNDLDSVKKHILYAYEAFVKNRKIPPTKRELYDYFFENFDYKKMHFEDFCHRANPLFLKFKATAKRKRKSNS